MLSSRASLRAHPGCGVSRGFDGGGSRHPLPAPGPFDTHVVAQPFGCGPAPARGDGLDQLVHLRSRCVALAQVVACLAHAPATLATYDRQPRPAVHPARGQSSGSVAMNASRSDSRSLPSCVSAALRHQLALNRRSAVAVAPGDAVRHRTPVAVALALPARRRRAVPACHRRAGRVPRVSRRVRPALAAWRGDYRAGARGGGARQARPRDLPWARSTLRSKRCSIVRAARASRTRASASLRDTSPSAIASSPRPDSTPA